MPKLAIDGGTPARKKPLPPNYPGAVVMGEAEAAHSEKVIMAQSPFRYYGPDSQDAVQTLEDTMSRDLGISFALAVNSGTSALIVALRALGIGYGDKVIVPANTFIATAGAVICCNAVPVFVDVDGSMNMDPGDLQRVYDPDVKAIICVPILGNPCDMDGIVAFAKAHDLLVIEDVAQSCGSKYKGKFAGTIGDAGVFSFQMNKIITSGEGGAFVTSDPRAMERAVRYHDQGMFRHKERYGIDTEEEIGAFAGQNFRMSEVTGAILQKQWEKLGAINEAMKANYRAIMAVLSVELHSLRYRTIVDEEGYTGSNLGMILSSKENALSFIRALAAENIDTHLLYGGKPIYMAPQIFHQRTADRNGFPFNYPFANPVRYSEQMCPRAVDLMARAVYLPISPLLTSADIAEITEGIVKVYRGLGLE